MKDFVVVAVADLGIKYFSATKQDGVGPSLQSRNTLHLQLAVHNEQWNWISRLGRYPMAVLSKVFLQCCNKKIPQTGDTESLDICR